jgi:UrcA family protein
MKKNLLGLTAAAVASALISSIAFAQNMQEITVQGTRVLNEKAAGRTPPGVPILDVTLSYRLSITDLDLASEHGSMALEKRVHDVALAACQEIGRKYPLSTPSDAVCAKVAADKAMVKVHELVAAAREKLPK